MRRIKRIHFVRLLSCLLAISFSLGSIANASTTGIMPTAQDEQTVTMHNSDSHQNHMQSAGTMSHVQMIQSGDYTGSHDMACEQLCEVSVSMLPDVGLVSEFFRLSQLLTLPESPDFVSDLNTLLFRPPRV